MSQKPTGLGGWARNPRRLCPVIYRQTTDLCGISGGRNTDFLREIGMYTELTSEILNVGHDG